MSKASAYKKTEIIPIVQRFVWNKIEDVFPDGNVHFELFLDPSDLIFRGFFYIDNPGGRHKVYNVDVKEEDFSLNISDSTMKYASDEVFAQLMLLFG